MRTPGDLRFVVHVAGAPLRTEVELVQRCAVCGFVLLDNTGWLTGDTAVPNTGAPADPSWYPSGALVATDKTDQTRGGMSYVHPSGQPLTAEERPCV